MKTPKLEANKVLRAISWHGEQYEFYRYSLNKFKEIDYESEPKLTVVLKGIYHESHGYESLTTNEATQYTKRSTPMILTKFEDGSSLELGDRVTIGNILYKVIKYKDLNNLSLIADISLEVVK